MAFYRSEKKKNFTVISNSYLDDDRLSWQTKGIFTKILSLPDNWRFSIRGLATICKRGVDAIRTVFDQLISCGYVRRYQTKDSSGRFSESVYDIFEVPQDKNAQLPAIPPCTTSSCTGKSTQQSTNVTKNVINQKESKNADKPSKEARKSFDDLIAEFTRDNNLQTALKAWLQVRFRLRKPLTDMSLQMALQRLKKAAGGAIETMIEIVESAVVNGWTDFKPITNKTDGHAYLNPCGKRVSAQNYQQREYTEEQLNSLMADVASLSYFDL